MKCNRKYQHDKSPKTAPLLCFVMILCYQFQSVFVSLCYQICQVLPKDDGVTIKDRDFKENIKHNKYIDVDISRILVVQIMIGALLLSVTRY